MMHTEQYCDKLENLDRVKAIRAIHEAWIQLSAMGPRPGNGIDNFPVIASLASCLADAGHMGFDLSETED